MTLYLKQVNLHCHLTIYNTCRQEETFTRISSSKCWIQWDVNDYHVSTKLCLSSSHYFV